jgi:hypothetical protein
MTDKEARQPIELTIDERASLERLASAESPFSQRAQALLASSDGADLAGAGLTAGLTANQVRYWLGRFGTRRLSIFPEELLTEQAVEEEAQMEPPLLAAPEEAPLLKAPELAGELTETVPDAPKAAAAAAVAAAGGTAAVKSKKDKKDKKTKSGTAKKKAKDKTDKKDKMGKKSKKDKKSKKAKKGKKGKKSEKVKKAKKAKKDKKKK